MPYLRLSKADQERLGVPERLPLDIVGITNREAIEIAKLGYKTPLLFRRALFHTAEDGWDPVAWTAAVWLVLRRVGVEVDVNTLEFNVDELDFEADEQPETPQAEEPGKAPARSRSSARKTSTSGGTSRARSRSTSSRS